MGLAARVQEQLDWCEAQFGAPPTSHSCSELECMIRDAREALARLDAQLAAQRRWEYGCMYVCYGRFGGATYEEIAAGLRAENFHVMP